MQSETIKTGDSLAGDLLVGAAAIAEYTGFSERQIYHQVETGSLPVKRMGRLLIGSRTALRRFFSTFPEIGTAA
jgi:hypothetical protein